VLVPVRQSFVQAIAKRACSFEEIVRKSARLSQAAGWLKPAKRARAKKRLLHRINRPTCESASLADEHATRCTRSRPRFFGVSTRGLGDEGAGRCFAPGHELGSGCHLWPKRQIENLILPRLPRGLEVHLVMDNYATHKVKNVRAWFARHPRYHVRFTPTGASWLNSVERLIADVTERCVRRGSYTAVRELEKAMLTYLDE
jgi:hypothetical protein